MTSKGDRRVARGSGWGLLRMSVRGRGSALAVWALWSAVEAVPAFLSGRLVAAAVDRGFLHHDVLAGLGLLALLAMSLLAGAWGTRQAYGRLSAVIEPFRDELVRRTVAGSLKRSARAARSDATVVARLTQQVEIVREAYGTLLTVAQGFLITSTSALIGLLALLPVAVPLVAIPLAAGGVLFLVLVPWMAVYQRRSIIADERVAGLAGAMCEGLRDITACGAEELIAADLGMRVDEQARVTVVLARLSAVRALAVGLGSLLPILLVLADAPSLIRGGATTGAILGALTYVLEGVHPALQTLVRNIGNTGVWLGVTLRRLVDAIEPPGSQAAPLAATDPPAAGAALRGPRPPHLSDASVLQLRRVSYAYGPGAEPVICGLDLTIAAGERLAVVGPSGAGKSTLVNIIAGLLAPQRGDVWYGQTPVHTLTAGELARRRVLIPQEAYVFGGSLRENLTYHHERASEDELHRAVDCLGMQELVARAGGLDARLDIQGLSAGERQLISLARAYLSPAPLLILDEATCHLDPAREARVEDALARRGGTLIVVAHRISSALRARHVLVLDGRQPLLDTHHGLLETSSLYRDLVGHWDVAARPEHALVQPAA